MRLARGLHEKTAGRIAPHDGPAALPALHERFVCAHVELSLGHRSRMTGLAFVDQHRLDVPVVGDRLLAVELDDRHRLHDILPILLLGYEKTGSRDDQT